jgi:hypothetical protein
VVAVDAKATSPAPVTPGRAARALRWAAIAFACAAGAAVVPLACGARSDLSSSTSSNDPGADAGRDGRADATPDGSPDAPADAPADAEPDVFVRDCDPEAGVTYVYLVTEQNEIFSFDPDDSSLELHGTLDCPSNGPTPFSMAVNRTGKAYVLFDDGRLFRVSLADASCDPTEYVPGQLDFNVFGMGFATDQAGPDESLYVAEINPNGPSDGLARIDTDTLELQFIAPFSETFGQKIELTGTGDGRLFGYVLSQPGPGGTLVEIDKQTATIVSSTALDVGPPGSALAFAFWGGDFYIFTTQAGGIGTDVTRYQPGNGSLDPVGALSTTVVGAGVSTCAPQ